MKHALVALALAGALAGCGDDTPKQAAPSAASAPQHLEIADTFDQAGGPEWLQDGFDHVWVHKDDGYLLGLDPESGEVTATLDSGYHGLPACQGLGRDETALWTCGADGALVRIDPTTGTATPVPAHKRSDEGRLAFSSGLLWFLETGSNDLVGLDDTGAEQGRIALGEVCTDLAYDDTRVFALCPTGHHVLRVDTEGRKVTGSLDVVDPRNATMGADLFVGDGAGMLQVDPDSLEIRHTYDDVGPGLLGNIDATGTEVWVREEEGTFLTEIDPRTFAVLATVDAPDYPSGGDVLVTDDWVWATASDDDAVLRVAR